MWFGDLVTMAWWDDLWLNESFADWMGDKISQEVAPEYHYDVREMGGIQELMQVDARPSTPAIRKHVTGTENLLQEVGIAYDKGKAVLGMFENWVGEDRFRQGVRDYLHAHEWGSAVASDLWDALSKAAGRDVGDPMASFIDQNGLPLVGVEVLADGSVKLTQQRFLNAGVQAEPRTWQIPIALDLFDGKSVTTETVLLDTAEKTLPPSGTKAPRWVDPDAGARGYYRWKVSPKMLTDLAKDASKRLSVRERYGLIGNMSALLGAGVLHGDELLRSLQPFGLDPDPLVLDAVFDAMNRAKEAFVTDELREPFARYVRQTLGPTLKRIGMKPAPNEPVTVSLLRPQLLRWLGVEGQDEKVLQFADAQAKAYRSDPASVNPALAEVSVRLAARHGDRALFDEYRKRFETAQIPAQRRLFLSALGCFRDPTLQAQALSYTLSGPLRPNELRIVSECMDDTEEDHDKTFHWTLENYDSIVKRLPPMFASFMPFVAGGCSADRLKQAQDFFAKPENQVPGTAETLEKVTDQVNDCVRLRQREGAAVASYLKGLAR